tara:strand:- start:159 stop:755 length:597 start_codon:yes stop_codon:yes gene_type:complete
MALRKIQKSLRTWTKQKWRTPSGKKSSETGEVYAPEEQIKRLKSTKKGRAKLARANKKKRAATRSGKQHARHGLHSRKKLNEGKIVSPFDGYYNYFQPQFQVAYDNEESLRNAVESDRQKAVKWATSSVGKYNDKYYIVPTRSDETGEKLRGDDRLNQILPLIEEGSIQGYKDKQAAEADRTKLIKNLFSTVIQQKIS